MSESTATKIAQPNAARQSAERTPSQPMQSTSAGALAEVLALQQAAGNTATGSFVAAGSTPPPGLIQRQCAACAATGGGKCAKC